MASVEKDEVPVRMTVAQRIAALQNQAKGTDSPGPKTKPNKIDVAGRVDISSLQQTIGPAFISSQKKYASAAKENSSKENEEMSENNTENDSEKDIEKVGKIKKLPPGAVPVMMPFGAGLPPSLMKKRMERESRNEKLREESEKQHATAATETCDDADEGLLSRPTIQVGQRRPRDKNSPVVGSNKK